MWINPIIGDNQAKTLNWKTIRAPGLTWRFLPPAITSKGENKWS